MAFWSSLATAGCSPQIRTSPEQRGTCQVAVPFTCSQISRAVRYLGLLVLLVTGGGPAAAFDPSQLECNGVTGLSQPLPLCSPDSPCSTQLGESITTPSSRPVCASLIPDAPTYNDEPVFPWLDNQGTVRFACVYKNPGASLATKLPLLLVLHGGESSAGFVYNRTLLREKAESFDLSGDPSRPGFNLVSVQGRNIHYPTGLPPFSREGTHHDFYYRDFSTFSTNPDIKFLDLVIDLLVEQDIVDPQRIYVLGHSNGGFMAQAYGIARHDTPTPGGNFVAAAAGYGSADPFNNVYHSKSPSCQLDPYPKSTLPIFLLQRDCDSQNACNFAQQQRFGNSPGYNLRFWLSVVRNIVGNPNVDFQLIDSQGFSTSTCAVEPQCTAFRGTINHIKWPDGRNDNSAIDWEIAILNFLRDHPYAGPAQ